MKNYKKLLNQQGFTLVELMVVVAIIGILASIAIPNYTKYQAKARQTEARVALASVYTAEKSFQVEQSSYTLCLEDIGVGFEAGKRFYAVGFDGSAGAVANTCGPTGALACDRVSWVSNDAGTFSNGGSACAATQMSLEANARVAAGGTIAVEATLVPTRSDVAQATFTAGAAGQIQSAANVHDMWTVDQNKNIVNTTPNL